MALIEFQFISNGLLPRGGKGYIGPIGNEEPELNPSGRVYLNYQHTDSIDISDGVLLGSDGQPMVNGVKTDLYTPDDYSFMIRDSYGAKLWPKARQYTVNS